MPSRTSPSSAAGRSGWRARGAPRSAACACACSTRASRARGTSPPGCSRPSPRRSFGEERAARAEPARRRRLPGVLRGAGGRVRAATPACARPARSSSPATATRPRSSTALLAVPPAARARRRAAAARARPAAPSRRWRPTVRLALDVAGDHSVDPRRLVAALAAAVERRGRGAARAARRATGLAVEGERVTGVELAGGETRRRRHRRGRGRRARRRGSTACRRGARVPVRPVKGQVLRLRDPGGPGLIDAQRPHAATPTSSRAATAATCSARRWRSGAWTRRRPRAACSSCCATSSEVVPGVLELEIEERRSPACAPRRRTTCPRSAPARWTGCTGRRATSATASCSSGLSGELVAAALCGEPLPAWAAAAPTRSASRGVPA